jgi:hypothetical protein
MTFVSEKRNKLGDRKTDEERKQTKKFDRV